MDPAKDYLYTREIRKKFKVGISCWFMKNWENVTLIGEKSLFRPTNPKK